MLLVIVWICLMIMIYQQEPSLKQVGISSIVRKQSTSFSELRHDPLEAIFVIFGHSFFNPLSAKQSFQLWYPGGQRLKVISFSWFWVKSPSKCFSNAEPTTIIASRDEKRCNASVQWTRLVHSRSLRLGDQHRKCHGWLLFFAVADLHPDQRDAELFSHMKEKSE